jgi:hypothetical protein
MIHFLEIPIRLLNTFLDYRHGKKVDATREWGLHLQSQQIVYPVGDRT